MMLDRKRWMVWAMVGLAMVATVGCRRGDNRQALHGTVTMDGNLLADGSISFRPVPGSEGGTSGSMINKDGEFSIPAAKGLLPGKYLVTVQVWRDTDQTFTTDAGTIEKVRAPLPYKEHGKLEVEVVAGGDNRFDLKLTGVKK